MTSAATVPYIVKPAVEALVIFLTSNLTIIFGFFAIFAQHFSKMTKFSFFLPFLVPFIAVSCGDSKKYLHSEGVTWNTQYHITYQASTDLSDSIRVILDSIDSELSFFNPDSQLSALNASRDSLEVGVMLREVYDLSSRVSRLTGGAFDPTVSPAISAWGFGKGHAASPDTLALDSLKDFVGFDKTRFRNGHIIKEDPRLEFNFSAVAKGYGVDRVAQMLTRNGVTDFLVEIGGEIRASGKSPSGKDWKIGIDTPKEDSSAPGGEPMKTVSFTGKGMATSGNYRNFHKDSSGRSFGHTISPKTLRPVKTDILSATVMAPTCAEADALATASMVLGHERASSLMDSLGYPALFIIERDGEFTTVPNKYWKED